MNSNKDTLQSLMKELSLSQTRCARVISEITLRPLSARAVRAWLTSPDNPSARNCPDWAINALVEYKSRPMVFDDEEELTDTGTPQNNTGTVEWTDKSKFPYSIEELDAAFTAAMEEGKRSKLEQIRYRCPRCRLRVFGQSDLWVVCGKCGCALVEMSN